MKTMKKVAAVLLAVMLMAPAAVNAAAPSATKATIAGQKAAVSTVYTGKAQLPATVTINGKTLNAGQDFVYVNAAAKTDAGTYTVSIKGIGAFEGTATVTYTVSKAAAATKTTKVAAKKAYKASSLKKKAKKFSVKVAGATYTVKGKKAKKYIKVSKKGKVTVKKGIKKGTYKIVIKVKATKNTEAGKKVVSPLNATTGLKLNKKNTGNNDDE